MSKENLVSANKATLDDLDELKLKEIALLAFGLGVPYTPAASAPAPAPETSAAGDRLVKRQRT